MLTNTAINTYFSLRNVKWNESRKRAVYTKVCNFWHVCRFATTAVTGCKRRRYVVINCVAQQCVVLRKLKLYANVQAARYRDSMIVSVFQQQKWILLHFWVRCNKESYKCHAKAGKPWQTTVISLLWTVCMMAKSKVKSWTKANLFFFKKIFSSWQPLQVVQEHQPVRDWLRLHYCGFYIIYSRWML